jgi:hypothetical protein
METLYLVFWRRTGTLLASKGFGFDDDEILMKSRPTLAVSWRCLTSACPGAPPRWHWVTSGEGLKV